MNVFCKISLVLLLFSITACKNTEESDGRGDKIIKKTIEKAGGKSYDSATISFKFRGLLYKSIRNCGNYTFYRIQQDSTGNKINDVLSNDGFKHLVNAKEKTLPDSTTTKLSNSLNSVHYFVQLPFGLADAAVHKKYRGEERIRGKKYDKIEVSFAKEGGGKDHSDKYMYWISQKERTIDYFGYAYDVNGGGMRFREAYNPRRVGGIRFVDYKNYAPEDFKKVKLKDLAKLFEEGELDLFSSIRTKEIKVSKTKGNCS